MSKESSEFHCLLKQELGGAEVVAIITPLLHSLLYSLSEIRDIFPPVLTQLH